MSNGSPWWKLLLAAAGGFLLAVALLGRYEYVPTNNRIYVWRMNKLTGGAALCSEWEPAHFRCQSVDRNREKELRREAAAEKAKTELEARLQRVEGGYSREELEDQELFDRRSDILERRSPLPPADAEREYRLALQPGGLRALFDERARTREAERQRLLSGTGNTVFQGSL